MITSVSACGSGNNSCHDVILVLDARIHCLQELTRVVLSAVEELGLRVIIGKGAHFKTDFFPQALTTCIMLSHLSINADVARKLPVS